MPKTGITPFPILTQIVSAHYPDMSKEVAKPLIIKQFELDSGTEDESLEQALAHYFDTKGNLSATRKPLLTFYGRRLIRLLEITYFLETEKIEKVQIACKIGFESNGVLGSTVDCKYKEMFIGKLQQKYPDRSEAYVMDLGIDQRIAIVVEYYHKLNPRNDVNLAIKAMYKAVPTMGGDYTPEQIGKAYLEYIQGKMAAGVEQLYWCGFNSFIRERRYVQEKEPNPLIDVEGSIEHLMDELNEKE